MTLSIWLQRDKTGYTKENPGHFEDYHPNFRPVSWHMLNHSHWCVTEADVQRIIPQAQKQASGRKRWWILFTGENSAELHSPTCEWPQCMCQRVH